jgi:hypothetical protein
MKSRYSIIGSLAGLVALSPFVLFLTACKSPTDEEIRKTIEIVDVSTKWVAKEYKQWPQAKLTLVPTVSFRARNLSGEPLRYVNFNGIFKEKEAVENLGDNFLSAIRGEPVLPGALSPVITLKSNFGVEGKRLDDFKNNPHWKTYFVKIFVQMKGSRHVLMGEWPVSRIIDFKEDQPVHMGGEKKEPDKK